MPHYLLLFTAKTVLNPDRLYRRQNLSNGSEIHHAEGHDQRYNASPWLHGSLPRSGCLAQVLLLGGRYQIIFTLGQIKFARDFRLVRDNSFDMETWSRFRVSLDVLSDMRLQFCRGIRVRWIDTDAMWTSNYNRMSYKYKHHYITWLFFETLVLGLSAGTQLSLLHLFLFCSFQ